MLDVIYGNILIVIKNQILLEKYQLEISSLQETSTVVSWNLLAVEDGITANMH